MGREGGEGCWRVLQKEADIKGVKIGESKQLNGKKLLQNNQANTIKKSLKMRRAITWSAAGTVLTCTRSVICTGHGVQYTEYTGLYTTAVSGL
jgi:hypothetical protein